MDISRRLISAPDERSAWALRIGPFLFEVRVSHGRMGGYLHVLRSQPGDSMPAVRLHDPRGDAVLPLLRDARAACRFQAGAACPALSATVETAGATCARISGAAHADATSKDRDRATRTAAATRISVRTTPPSGRCY